jgi:flagellin
MLQRIRELAVQYNNGTLSTSDQGAIQSEVSQLTSEITRIGQTAQFNGIALFSSTSTISFQVGANDGEIISVSTQAMSSIVGTISLGSATTLSSIDGFIGAVSDQRAAFGAVQNRLQYTLDNLATYEENLTSSLSRIRDVDMASEMVNFTKEQILQQAGTSMLAQANSAPQSVLKLLQ